MDVIELRVTFDKTPGFTDEEFATFSGLAKNQGLVNTLQGKDIITCFDSMHTKVILNNKQLLYNVENPADNDLTSMDDNIISLAQGLIELSENSQVHIRIIETEKTSYDTHEKSRSKNNIFNDIEGLGQRYIIKQKYGLGDFKFEPLIRNNNAWFFDATYNYDSISDFSKLSTYIKYAFDDFYARKEKLLSIM